MNRQRPNWSESLRTSPFLEPRFTEQIRLNIMSKAREKVKKKSSVYRYVSAMAILLVIGVGIWAALPKILAERENAHTAGNLSDPWTVRAEYRLQGESIFQIYPDPYLSAGSSFGYMIHFTAPFETFAGKKISIYAYHKESNTRVTALLPQTISEPSSGYRSLERFTMSFALPFSGIWRYEVKLNDQFYGDAVLPVAEPSWALSPTFDVPYIGNDGKEHRYVLAGEEGKVGFIVGPYVNEKGEELDQMPIVAGKGNKYMWHFWGTDDELNGEFKVLAVKQGTTKMVDVFSASSLGSGLSRADRTVPSLMSLPEPGLWRLMAYVDDRLFGSIVVEVQ